MNYNELMGMLNPTHSFTHSTVAEERGMWLNMPQTTLVSNCTTPTR